MGDVVFDEEDIFGDGINIAARLQEASNEEAVLISNVVYRSLGERLAEQFHRAGARQFKNASSPVEVFQWSPPGFAPPRLTPAIHSKSLLIGVLPFDRLSSDPDQEFFADGITEEVITTLSNLPDLLVVARNSAFVYKGRSVDVK